MSPRFSNPGPEKKSSASKANPTSDLAKGELADVMLVGMREMRAKGLSVEEINRRCLEAMRSRGKYR
jgi:hypothetical protein